MEFLYAISYYVGLFVSPFVIYILFLNGRSSTRYVNKGWWYYLKLIPAKRKIIEIIRKNDVLSRKLDSNITFPKALTTNSQCIYGADHEGNTFSLRFVLRANGRAEISLILKHENILYSTPGQNVTIVSTHSNQWKTKDLFIEVLEPYKRLRVCFNGFLEANNLIDQSKSIKNVQFNLIWACAGAPHKYPEDADPLLLADSVARTVWRDGSWMDVLNNLNLGFDQFGGIQGWIKICSSEAKNVHFTSCRSRYTELDVRHSLDQQGKIFGASYDGTLFALEMRIYKPGGYRLVNGSVISSNGDINSIIETDLDWTQFNARHELPQSVVFHIKTRKKVIKCVFHMKKSTERKFVNLELTGSKLSNIQAACDINTNSGNAIIECWSYQNGPGLDLPPALIIPKKITVIPNDLVVNFRDEKCKIVELTGGKGNSLGLLVSLKSSKFIVPNGFVVTVQAYNQQINVSGLRHSIQNLEKACWKQEANLDQFCNETVNRFKSTVLQSDICDAICKELQLLDSADSNHRHGYAVRSSAIGEDSEAISAAGQNETFLGCHGKEAIFQAVVDCWASQFTYQSVQYRIQHGLHISTDMAVVVQKMCPAETAGVLFTCHPTTHNISEIVITSNYGLGESVVSGKSDPDTIILTRSYEGKVALKSKEIGQKNCIIKLSTNGIQTTGIDKDIQETFSISDANALALAEIGVELENLFGGARDVEWAIFENKIYLLQCRPITTSSFWSDYELLHEFDVPILSPMNVFTMANVAEVFVGAVGVLSQSTILWAVDKAVQQNVLSSRDDYVLKCTPTIQHHVILDVINSVHKNASRDVKLTSKILDLALFGHPVIDDQINFISQSRFGFATASNLLKETLRIVYYAYNNCCTILEASQRSKSFDLKLSETNTSDMIYKKISNSFEELVKIASCHCRASSVSVFYQIIAMNLLVEQNNDLSLDHCLDFALILSSCKEVESAEVPQMLENISITIKTQSNVDEFINLRGNQGSDWLENNCPEAFKQLQEFLVRHGHRLLGEFELKEDSWGMDPTKVIGMLQSICKSEPRNKKNILSDSELIASLKSPKSSITKKLIGLLLNKIRTAVARREKTKSEVIRTVNKLRLAYRQLATKMVEEGLIPNKTLIYQLSHYEIGLVLKRKNHELITKAVRRQKLYMQWNRFKFPEIMYGVPTAENEIFKIAECNSEIKLTGTPVCNGTVKARACVITTLEEIHLLHPGDILITYCTDIGWSPYFPLLSGIVTELGGLVSHGAVVAREYGLPSIVGVQKATKTFKTGDVVLLRGTEGILSLATS